MVLAFRPALSEREEIPDQALAVYGEHALGVKLDALNGKASMPQAHDGPVAVTVLDARGYFKLFRHTFVGNDQRVIARAGHGAGKAGEEIAAIVLHRAGFAMH